MNGFSEKGTHQYWDGKMIVSIVHDRHVDGVFYIDYRPIDVGRIGEVEMKPCEKPIFRRRFPIEPEFFNSKNWYKASWKLQSLDANGNIDVVDRSTIVRFWS